MKIGKLDRLSINIEGCPRCGQDHEDMFFQKLTRPDETGGWWGLCPENAEPLIAHIPFAEDNPNPSALPTVNKKKKTAEATPGAPAEQPKRIKEFDSEAVEDPTYQKAGGYPVQDQEPG